MTARKRAYSYARFSSAEQAAGDSIRRQAKMAEDWCARNDAELAEPFRDEGVSAFRGKHRYKGALSRFLNLVSDGTIEPGSYLIVESFDRLSREDVKTALGLFLQITGAGITIVTLIDGMEFGPDCDERDLIMTLLSFSRAHSENVHRAERSKAAWEAKRDRKTATGQIITGKCPAWMEPKANRKGFKLIPSKARVVRRVFDLAAEGAGVAGIAKTLNTDGTPPIGRAPVWTISYIRHMLESRSVIGEFTPHQMVEGKRVPLPDSIPDYYPAAVPLAKFHAVQTIRRARPSYRGPKTSKNVFAHVIRDWMGGSVVFRENRRGSKVWGYLIQADAARGLVKRCGWSYNEFLSEFLTTAKEAARAPEGKSGDDPGEIDALKAELAEVALKAERAADAIMAMGGSETLTKKLLALEAERTRLGKEIAAAESEAIAVVPSTREVDWSDTDTLRANIRRTVKRIVVCAELRWFVVEFFDGLRVFRSLAMPKLGVTWTASHRTLAGVSGSWVDVDDLCEGLKGLDGKSPRERLLWVRWQFIKAGSKAAGVSVRSWAKSLGYVVKSPLDYRLE